MYVRKKHNRSGTVSIVIVDKSSGKYKEVKTIGVAQDKHQEASLLAKAKEWIEKHTKGEDIFRAHQQEQEELQLTKHLLSKIENILLNGIQLLVNRVYDSIGFDKIKDDELRYLVVSRLGQPLSKSATVEYLKTHFNEDTDLNKIYRYLDKLYKTQQEEIQQISVSHTRKILGGKIGLLFYDVTTLYFETDKKDDLREPGFSKDGKHSQSQIVLGLLVSKEGYPLSYALFNGAQYEGRTMLPILEDFVHRFALSDFVIVADSGLMNKTNLALLEAHDYKYIIGERIKNIAQKTKNQILCFEKKDGLFHQLKTAKGRLIISYSKKRAKKDAYNRDKGIKRLEKAFKSGKITKENVNKRGYNKFLEITDNVHVHINQEKIEEDKKWDGLKGYITNTTLDPEEVYEQYRGLWVIERAFRVTKGTLQTRPIFHFTPRRIEAHVCICFVAYKVYKELERILKLNGFQMSVDSVLSIAKTITTLEIKLTEGNRVIQKTMLLTKKQKEIAMLFEDDFWKNSFWVAH